MTWLVEHPDILGGYREGKADAWSAIYQQYVDGLRRFVGLGFSFESRGSTHRFAGYTNPIDVDDIVQECFVRAFSEPARLGYDGVRSFQNYLFAIARNLVIRNLRHAGKTVADPDGRVASDGEQAVVDTKDPGPEQQLIDGEWERELVQALREFRHELSQYDQRFFELRFRDQLTQEETAKRLRISRSKVRTIEQRVRDKLIRFLKGRDHWLELRQAVMQAALLLLMGMP
jgi:RNA polymerase sigma factor (sigma-70 family)